MKKIILIAVFAVFANFASAKKIKIKIVSCNAAPINPIACPQPQSWVTPSNSCWVTPTGQMWFIP
jgi:hypothetical protein